MKPFLKAFITLFRDDTIFSNKNTTRGKTVAGTITFCVNFFWKDYVIIVLCNLFVLLFRIFLWNWAYQTACQSKMYQQAAPERLIIHLVTPLSAEVNILQELAYSVHCEIGLNIDVSLRIMFLFRLTFWGCKQAKWATSQWSNSGALPELLHR